MANIGRWSLKAMWPEFARKKKKSDTAAQIL